MSSEATVISPGPFNRIGVGTVLNELYVIDSLIGAGGMGEVFKGHAIETGEQVAIKTIRAEHAQNSDALALFKKEAKALRKLYHDAIVRYFVFTIDKPLGLPYLAMEYVEGESLSDMLRRGPLEFEQLRILLRRVASGLHAAHEHGIIHRDVSPDNIIVPEGNFAHAKIIDFGIARSHLGEKTVIGSGFAGKFSYVSPEQLGLHQGEVTAQSDIYSLGLVIAEATLGKPLDMGHSHVEVIEKRRSVPDLSQVDPRIRPLLQSMLQPNPKDRPPDMAAIAEWEPQGAGPSRGRSMRRLGGALAAVLLLGAAGAGGWYLSPVWLDWWNGAGRPAATPGGVPAPSAPGSDLPDRPAPEPPPPAAPTGSGPGTPVLPATPPASEPAGAPPVQETPPAEPRTPPTIEQIANYLRGYRGGECFFVTPMSISSREAVIEAFGATPAPFIAFDADFQKVIGFEPEIHLRQVSSAQCPVVDLLVRQAAQRNPRVPRLNIASDRLKSGEELSGTVDIVPNAQLEVLLVADDGLVYSLTGYLKRSGEVANFGLRLEGASAGEPKPQLVVAVASPRPLASLKGVSSVQAEQVFRQVQEELARSGQTIAVSVRYLKLGG